MRRRKCVERAREQDATPAAESRRLPVGSVPCWAAEKGMRGREWNPQARLSSPGSLLHSPPKKFPLVVECSLNRGKESRWDRT